VEWPRECVWLRLVAESWKWIVHFLHCKWNFNGSVLSSLVILIISYKIAKFTGKPIPINSTVDSLYPTVSMYGGFGNVFVEANFGDDSAKAFQYNIYKCLGVNLD
jgi:hypothetical protein